MENTPIYLGQGCFRGPNIRTELNKFHWIETKFQWTVGIRSKECALDFQNGMSLDNSNRKCALNFWN